jgi:hypothetical protein
MKRKLTAMAMALVGMVFTTRDASACWDGPTPPPLRDAHLEVAKPLACGSGNMALLAPYVRNEFRIWDPSWSDWGRENPCDLRYPYGKMVAAVYMLLGGLQDQISPRTQWHSSAAYLELARTDAQSLYKTHDGYRMRFINQYHRTAAATSFRFPTSRVDMYCASFNTSPVSLASTMVHEAWHHYGYHSERDFSHRKGPKGACKAESKACDYFYPHTISSFPFERFLLGRKSDPDPSKSRYVGAFQITVEYLSDIVTSGSRRVSKRQVDLARHRGNRFLSENFINTPGYTVGEPRPFER